MVEHPTQPASTELRFISHQLSSIEKGQTVAQATREHHTVLIAQILLLLQQLLARQSSTSSGPGLTNRFLESLTAVSKKVDLVHKLYRLWVWSRYVRWPAYVYGALRYVGWA